MSSQNSTDIDRQIDDQSNDRFPWRRRKKSNSGKKKRRIWPIAVVLLVAFVFLLPTIIGSTSLKQQVVDWAFAEFDGRVTLGSAGFGWFSPIRMNDVSITDGNGDPLADVAGIETSRMLIAFLFAKDLGEIRIQQPRVHVQLRPDGSNLEDALASFLEENDENQTPLISPRLKVTVGEGQVLVQSTTTNEQWHVAGLNAEISLFHDIPLATRLECQFHHEGNTYGGLAIAAQSDPGSESLDFESVQAAINAQNLPLAILAPIGHRVIGPTVASGYASGEFQAQVSVSTGSAQVDVSQMQLTQAMFAAPGWLGNDRLFTERTTAQGQLNLSTTQIAASGFRVSSDLGNINIDGSVNLDQLNSLLESGQMMREPFQLDGRIDVARLAAMLPETLQLHQDLTIDAGEVSFQAATRVDRDIPRLVFNMDTANLSATRGGKPLVWQKPLRLVGTLFVANGAIAMENVRCDSDFLTVEGNGTLAAGRLQAEGDLERLVQRIQQFADLGDTKLAGKLNGSLAWETDASAIAATGTSASPIRINGRMTIDKPVFQLPGMSVWNPSGVDVSVAGTGQSLTDGVIRIDQSNGQITVGTEKLHLESTGPIENLWNPGRLQFNCRATGSGAGWLAHLENFGSFGEIAVAGTVDANAIATLEGNSLRLNKLRYDILQFAFEGYSTTINEEKIGGNANLKYDLETGKMEVANFSAIGSSVAANTRDFEIMVADPMIYRGDIYFRGDVNRISDWWEWSPNPEDIRWFGNAEGSVQVSTTAAGQLQGLLQSRIKDFVAAQQAAAPVAQSQPPVQQVANQKRMIELWREAIVKIDSQLSLASDYNSVTFQNLAVDCSALKATVQGSINDLAGKMVADLAGTWQPDWQTFNSVLKTYAGDQIQFAGNQSQSISMKGPLFPTTGSPVTGWVDPELKIQTRVAWDQARLMNVTLGGSSIDVDLSQAIASLQINRLPIAGNELSFAPKIDLRTEEPVLYMQQGKLIDNLQLTPETCRQYLKYVAPMVADATSAQGQFSVTTGGLQLPLMDPIQVSGKGGIQMKNVTIGAGPLAHQIIAMVDQVKALLKPGSSLLAKDHSAWIRMSEQTIPIAIQDQRVFHDGLTFTYKDVSVQTRGSVGFDQSLNLVAVIPILDAWIANEPWLAGLKGQSISVPISGTVTKPRLDGRVIQQLSTQLARKAAGGAINKAVQDKWGIAPNEIQDTLNNKVQGELDRAQQKLNDKFQEEVTDRLENELLNGINSLFKQKKDK